MKTNNVCKSCSIRGYSPEICSLHHKFMGDGEDGHCSKWWPSEATQKQVGKTLALGACAGLLTSAVGLSAACLFGLKGLCETYLAAKVVVGSGMAGAMTSVAIKPSAADGASKQSKKRKHFVPPLYLNGS
jgi:hypothetical protein